MITFLRHNQIDKKKWDAVIEKDPRAHVFVYSWYLDINCKNWEALIWNDYEVVFPLTSAVKYTVKYLYQPFFTNYYSLYSAKGNVTQNIEKCFFDTLSQKYKYIDINIFHIPSILKSSVKLQERKAQQIELKLGYEKIKKNYSENTTRNIKKALKHNWKWEENIDAAAITKGFKNENAGKIKKLSNADYFMMDKLVRECTKSKKGFSVGLYNEENTLCASAFFVYDHDVVIYYKGFVNEYGKKNGAMHLLMDKVIQQFAGKNVVFDFGGSDVPTIARFNKSFGANDYIYYRYKSNNLSPLLKLIKK